MRRKPSSSAPPPPAPAPVVSEGKSTIPGAPPLPQELAQEIEEARALEGFARLTAYVNSRREQLPGTLRNKFKSLSKATLGIGALGALLATGIAVAALRGPAAQDKASAAVDESVRPSVTEKKAPAAPAAGATAAEHDPQPSAKDANEATILLEQADKLLDAGRYGEVLPVLDRLIARKPELKNDKRLTRILLKTAASGDAKAGADSFALLKGPMGETGAALTYELTLMTDANVAIKKRAELWLRSKEFERISPLQVYTAVKLRSAKSCEDKHSLLALAGNTGGKYVLDYLQELDKKSVCSPDALDDCFPCMRNDSKLKQAIEKVEAGAESPR